MISKSQSLLTGEVQEEKYKYFDFKREIVDEELGLNYGINKSIVNEDENGGKKKKKKNKNKKKKKE